MNLNVSTRKQEEGIKKGALSKEVKTPFVSIIISTFNRLDYITKCLESIKAQEYRHYEIVIIDDGSTENIRSLAKECDVFIRNPVNLGCAYSRNVGVLNSKGDILLFMDSDTAMLPNSLKKLPEIFNTDPLIGAVGGSGPPNDAGDDVQYILGRSYNDFHYVRGSYYYPTQKQGLGVLDIYDTHHLEAAFLAIPRDVFFKVGGFDSHFEYMGEDRDICLRIKDHGYRVIASLETRAIHYATPSDNPAKNPKTYGRFFLSKFLQVAIKRNGILGGIGWLITNIKSEIDYRYFIVPLAEFMKLKELTGRRNKNFLSQANLDEFYAKKIKQHLRGHIHFPRKSSFTTPSSIIFFLTVRCNALCKHCFTIPVPQDAKKHEIDKENILKMLNSLSRPTFIGYTGGEPFLRTDLTEIMDATMQSPMVENASLFSNASFPDRVESLCRAICSKYKKPFAIQTSLDGMPELHDKIRKIPKGFDKVLDTCDRLKKLTEEFSHFSYIIHITVMKQNVHEVEALIDFLEEKGYPSKLSIVRGNSFSTFRVPRDILDEDYNPPEKVMVSVEEVNDLLSRIKKKHPFYFSPYQDRKLKIMTDTLVSKKRILPCYAGYIDAVILSNGGIALCEQVTPFGNLNQWDWDLRRAWNSREAMDHRLKTMNCACIHGCNICTSMAMEEMRKKPFKRVGSKLQSMANRMFIR